jgi:hypothetical protein
MKIAHFMNGGFVLHGITGDFKGRVSAWYDKEGKLIDCEQYPSIANVRSIKRNGPMWQLCEKLGNRHKHTPITGSN